MGGGVYDQPGDPLGCVNRIPDKDMYFNSIDEGKTNLQRRVVCKSKAQNSQANNAPPPAPPPQPIPVPEEAARVKIFCFAWTPLRPEDEKLLPEVRTQLSKCDGHAFFTDMGSTGAAAGDPDVVKITVPEQTTPRTDGKWLWHRNMVGVLPAWTHLLNSMDLSSYDWVVHTELDHFLSPGRLRIAIIEYLRLLSHGSPAERRSVDQAMMLMFGNAFLFNSKMLGEMRRQWTRFGQPADASSAANGCPEFMRGRPEWPIHCSQDMVYPELVTLTAPQIAAYGRSGCGQFDAVTDRGKSLPAGCWEMTKSPFGVSESAQLETIRAFAEVQNMQTPEEAKKHYAGTAQAEDWKLLFWAKKVPILHHVQFASVHKLARELLQP
mmetsp:Transcript_19538/g.61356  ORF Transcript_19538/g.61356 Transcript_19538/m.61356 type:complete len:379 (-) Transcript_19538:39-1175(-)